MEEIRKNKKLWLHEGIADYLAWFALVKKDLEIYGDFSVSFYYRNDDLFKKEMENGDAQSMMPYIGIKVDSPLLEVKAGTITDHLFIAVHFL